VRTAISIATPHYGTPIADFYQSLRAEDMLGLVGKMAARWTTDGRLDQASKFLRERRRHIDRVLSTAGREEFARILQGVAEADLDDYTELRVYLDSLAKYRGALRRLRIRYMTRFNLRVTDDPDMRYVSFVSGAEAIRVRDVGTWLYRLGAFIAGGVGRVALPPLPNGGVVPADQVVSVSQEMGPDNAITLSPKLSDGVVPSASQFWGEFAGYVPLDHHAVIGRFDLLPAREPDLHELYATAGAGFARPPGVRYNGYAIEQCRLRAVRKRACGGVMVSTGADCRSGCMSRFHQASLNRWTIDNCQH